MSFRGKYRMSEKIVCDSLGHNVCLSPLVSFVDMGPISRHCGRHTRRAIEMQKVLEMLRLFIWSREHKGISADDATGLERTVPFDSKVCGWSRVSEQEEPTHVKSNGRQQQHVPHLPTINHERRQEGDQQTTSLQKQTYGGPTQLSVYAQA